ncbi:MAG: putative nucleotidyltransferase substrate binding domain-containing protein, partial [Bacteroidales bacterium]
LKKIIFPLVSSIRIYVLYYKVNATNTLSRLDQLAAHTDSNLDTKELQYIYNFLMFKRLEIQARAIMNHEPPDNMLDLSSLTSAEQHLLKHAVSKINEFMYGLNMEFVK